MKRLFACAVAAFASLVAGPAVVKADSVEVSGVHLCCPQCVRVATNAISKVDGVSEVKGDRATKTVKFTAKDEAATKAAKSALTEAGFAGTFKVDGKDLPADAPGEKKTEKVAEVTVKGAHICCGACKNAATKLFTNSKVEFPGKDTIKVSGSDLTVSGVLDTLHKAGFGGKVD
jgi:copper chaperone CopZ